MEQKRVTKRIMILMFTKVKKKTPARMSETGQSHGEVAAVNWEFHVWVYDCCFAWWTGLVCPNKWIKGSQKSLHLIFLKSSNWPTDFLKWERNRKKICMWMKNWFLYLFFHIQKPDCRYLLKKPQTTKTSKNQTTKNKLKILP